MKNNKPVTPATSRSVRAERLAAELRANFKRRKAQARARGAPNNEASDPDGCSERVLPPEGENKTRG